jgi:hypothetical protein
VFDAAGDLGGGGGGGVDQRVGGVAADLAGGQGCGGGGQGVHQAVGAVEQSAGFGVVGVQGQAHFGGQELIDAGVGVGQCGQVVGLLGVQRGHQPAAGAQAVQDRVGIHGCCAADGGGAVGGGSAPVGAAGQRCPQRRAGW